LLVCSDTCIFYHILNVVYELPEDGTDVPKQDGLAK
jgi:hypothetical protein